MSSDKQNQIGDYLLNDEIGSGGFAKVVLGTHIPTGEKVAIKIMDKEQILSDELNKERVLSEISILKIVRHNNIIKLYEVMETPQKIYLVMEYCDGGELFDYIVSKQHLSEKQACVFFQEIIDALTYLHSQNIVHRDVKPENILLESFGKSMTCKLIDFGISRTYTLDKLINTPCGTASYAPPEMHKGEEYYGLLSDVWSAGVLLYAMVFGYLPFCEEDEDTNIENIIKGNYEIPEEASPPLRDFLSHILDIDPLTRYDLDQIKKHPWYNIVTPQKALPGLIIGYHKIPLDDRILNVCEAYGFDKNAVKQSVLENKYDNKSAIYYIILNKMKKEGYDSIADLFSNDYIEYVKNPNNLIKKEDKEDNKKEEKKEELPLLDDALKPKEENKKENVDKQLINPDLHQIFIDNKLKPNKSEAELSVASESSNKEKKDKKVESFNSSPKRSNRNESYNSSPKRNNNNESNASTPKRNNNSYSSTPKRNNNNNSYSTTPKRNNNDNSYSSTPKRNNNDNSYTSTPKRKNTESSKSNEKSPEDKKNENNSNSSSPKKNEEIKKRDSIDSLKEVNNKDNENEITVEINPSNPLVTIEKKIIEEPNINVNTNKEEENGEKINDNITEKPIIEIKKEEIEIKQPEININVEPITIINKKEENKEISKEEQISNINPTLDEIIKENNNQDIQNEEPEKVAPIDVDIQTSNLKEENLPSIQIQDKNENEDNKDNKKLITLKEKLNLENENIIEDRVDNKRDKENENEIKIEQISKTANKSQPDISISNRPKDPKLSYSLMPKHSFLINSNTKKMLSFNFESDDNNNKLNTSFTMKLTDSLKENVLKMKNPKMKNPNKEKEISKALHEIKHKIGASSNTKKQKGVIPKPKNKKNKKILNEPLFKDNKKKDHTIIRNRNASAASNVRRRNNNEEGQEKNRKKKDVSSSMVKIERKNINNHNNIDLKNNIKRIKKDGSKDKEKRIENNAKKRNINLLKKNSIDDKQKKSGLNLKKNIPKPFPSTLKKKDNTSSAYVLNTTSNTKPPNKSVSSQIKTELKTPNKNLDKTHFQSMYHKLDNTNTNVNRNENQNSKLNKTIQLSDAKNKRSKIPYNKNTNKNNKKKIRITYKNYEEEDNNKNDANKTSEINYKKKNQNKMNITFNSNSMINLNKENKDKNKDSHMIQKRIIYHNKSNSMRGNFNNERENIYTQKNDNIISHRNLNNYHRVIPKYKERNNNEKSSRYDSVIKTERNNEKTKKYMDLSAYEGTKTEISNGKNGNLKILNIKIGQKQKNSYYGPIDINNIVIGNSTNEINEKIINILHRNRVKCWKLNPWKFYCNKNGEIFTIEIFLLSNKISINDNKDDAKEGKDGENKEEENDVKEFDIHSKHETIDDNNINNKDNNKNKTKKLFYITVLSKDSSNKAHAKNINKIINKRFHEMKNK